MRLSFIHSITTNIKLHWVVITSLCILLADAGPPLQGEIPIGLYSNGEDTIKTTSGVKSVDKLNVATNRNEESYRLPLSVQPVHYDLEIRPILDGAPSEKYTAPGRVTIRVKCHEQTNSITLHSKDIEIEHDQITVNGVDSGESIGVTNHTVDVERSFYIIHLESSLTTGREYLVTIPFTSKVATDRLDGLYLSSYKDENGATKYLATTQFQKDDASRAFPCFDEPSTAFRATFNVKVGRKEEYHSLANAVRIGDPESIPGLDGWVWDNHNTTVNMPPYIIAVIVSDFKSETAPEDLYRVPVRTWAAPPLMTNTSGKFSAQAAARMLSFFEEYFDYPYQLNKMDSVAIPDFAAGAMENWGLNTYRTNLMVWLEEENTRFERWRSAAVVAHELTHQWFGNLVTCEWWNDLWLNEGFARYMQFIAANHSGEDFRSLDRYVIDATQVAMAYDESDSTEPVRSNVTDRVVNIASRVIYEKAASLIRMMQSFLTEETLIKALRVYLKRHQYSGVIQEDLFTALTEQAMQDGTFAEYTVKEIMDTWTLQSGFPLVRVSRVDGHRLYISQERYRPDPLPKRNDNELWYIPVSYVTASNPDFGVANTRPKDWIDKNTILKSLTVPSTNEWVIVNPNAVGFYRVIYDASLTSLIQEQLEKDHTKISFASRSQLIDDYFRSASAKYINIQQALGLTRYLGHEDDFIVWTTVTNNLSPLNTKLADTDINTQFQQYILGLIEEPLRKIGVNQDPAEHYQTVVLRTQLMDFACAFGHEICKSTADNLFADWVNAASPPPKIPVTTDLQPMIYCGAVASMSTASNTTIQTLLLSEYVLNRDSRQQSLIVNAIACDQTQENLEKLLEKAIDNGADNEIDINTHGLQLMQSIGKNSEGRQLLLRFMKAKTQEITRIHGETAISNLVSTMAPYLSSNSVSDLPDQVLAFVEGLLDEENLSDAVRKSLEQSLQIIDKNSQWMTFYYTDIKTWLNDNS